MTRIDYSTEQKNLYRPRKGKFETVIVPPVKVFAIKGSGDPNTSQSFMDAMQVLYGLTYTLKFMLKTEKGVDVKVMPLEGLWWMDDRSEFSLERKDKWKWEVFIRQWDELDPALVNKALMSVKKKKPNLSLDQVEFKTFSEGLSVQTLYVGAYEDEHPTIAAMHEWIKEQGLTFNGHHHEIYLGDPRKTAPERLKTILRQPVKEAP